FKVGWSKVKSRRQVVILDSCFSAAFVRGLGIKDSGSVNLEQFLGGKGRAILTASDSFNYALTQESLDLSIYTHYLVEGIHTGGADEDDDGWIAVEELHAYASNKVREAAPAMTPKFYPTEEGAKILLSKSPKDDPKLKYRKAVEKREYQGRFTIPARKLLNSLRVQLRLEQGVAEAIEAEVLQPYREYQRKLQDYENCLVEALQAENPLSPRAFYDLKDYQQYLALLDEDVAPIEAKVLGQALPIPEVTTIADLQFQPNPGTYFEFDIIIISAEGKERNRSRGRTEFFGEDLGNGVILEMVKIPAGEFLMGAATGEESSYDGERPQHRVKVPEFWTGKFAVTQEQWSQVAGLPKVKLDLNPKPSFSNGAKRPVEQVSWDEAVEFCARLNGFVEARLSRKTGKSYRLPTEAEWEYACRAGTTTPFHFGETITSDLVNFNGNYTYGNAPKGEYREQTTDVGSFPANAFGLYDMHGNVWEWCADQWYGSYANKPDLLKQNGAIAWTEETTGMAPKPDKVNYRLLRGGSWCNVPWVCRSALRLWYLRGGRNLSIGFRVVCGVSRTS
ncbi:MAG: SUMF1/EgtB/PvdO family nonheme iron enzyme, partial [Leptolyngbyaceae cyanobacterium SL_5_14]|nr:SUMF1/EgtB/PvdO family nonheme iron enzyme [Leptolyngbyaceae cyanobacterium SL_5_14]